MKFLSKVILAIMLPCSALAWEPTKPISVQIGFGPGSGNELGFRVLSAAISKTHPDVNFIIELKPGASSVLSSNYLYESKPDGYTVGVPSYMGTFVTNDIWEKDIKKFKYNSFTNIMGLGKSPLVFVANYKSKINTSAELADLVKNTNHPITFAVGGGAHRMAFEYFIINANGNRDKVTFSLHRGPLQAVTSVASDAGIEFGIMPLSIALPLIQSKHVKIIGITGNRKMAQLPDVEPIKVNGNYINIYAAWALVLPPNTPADIVEWYRTTFTAALRTPEVQKYFYDNLIFLEESELTPAGLSKEIENLRNTWMPLSQQVNLLQ